MKQKKVLVSGVILLAIITMIGGMVLFIGGDKLKTTIILQGDAIEIMKLEEAFNNGDLDGAISQAQILVDKDSKNVEALATLANMYLQKGSLEFKEEQFGKKGLELADKIMELDSGIGYLIQGSSYKLLENFSQALTSYEKSLESIETVEALNGMGEVYYLMHDLQNSKQYFYTAAELNESYIPTRLNLARMFLLEKDFSKALENAKYVFESSKNNMVLSQSAVIISTVYINSKEHENFIEALRYQEYVTGLQPQQAIVWSNLADLEIKLVISLTNEKITILDAEKNETVYQYLNSALAHYEKAIELDNNEVNAYFSIVDILIFLNRQQEAVSVMSDASESLHKNNFLTENQKREVQIKIEGVTKELTGEDRRISKIEKTLIFLTQATSVYAAGIYGTPHSSRTMTTAAWSRPNMFRDTYHFPQLFFPVVNKPSKAKRRANSSPRATSSSRYTPTPTPTPTPPSPPVCSPSWGGWSACSATCGGGTQSRTQSCTGASQSQACNTHPCCGSADRETYKTTPEVTSAQRCNAGDSVVNWVNNSGLAANGGIAWTWNCNDGTADSNNCLAYKSGECGYDATVNPNNKPYNTRNEACRFGSFNSVKLVRVGGVGTLLWKCGTGKYTNKHIGDFSKPNNTTNGPLVDRDYYGPKSGGVECKCVPTYDYTCKATNTYAGSCNNNCGGTITERYQAYKKDTTCFPNEPVIFIDKSEYNTATGKHCTDQPANCAACGAEASQGGSYHESN